MATIIGTIGRDAFRMSDNARGGDDKLEGGDGTDFIEGDTVTVVADGTATCGNDRIFGNTGADELVGDAREIEDGATAVCGNDRLQGDFGDDRLWGDVQISDGSVVAGSDLFVFRRGCGNDRVFDFDDGPTGAQDRLHLAGYRGLNAFADLADFITQEDDDTVIDLGAATGQDAGLDTIRLLGTTATDFGANDFVF